MKKNINKISLKAFIHLFVNSENYNRRFCFILGSGASKEAGIPTGVEMAKVWVEELKKRYEENELEELMKELGVESIEPNSKNYFGIYDLLFHADYQEGYAYLESELEKGNPSLGHYVLAKILAGKRHNLVITTNFDSLIEDALFIYTNKHPLVVGHESLTEFINLNIERPIVAKIHRSLYFHPFNRQQETNTLAKGWEETLKNAFMVYTPVVIGYAGGDQSLMHFLKDDKLTMNGLYWCYWNKEEPSEEIVDLVNKKNGYMIPIDGFEQMMFMLSRKLDFINPEEEMRKVTQERIDKYNVQYDKFEKGIRKKAQGDIVEVEISNTIKEIDLFNKAQLKEAEIRIKREQTPQNFLIRANQYMRLKMYDKAIEDYNRVIKRDCYNVKAYTNRGYAYNEMKEYGKAINDYTCAIRLDSDNVEAYINRGYAYNEMKAYDKAIIDCTRAIELDSNNVEAYINRGYAYNGKKEYNKAIDDYTQAIKLQPDNNLFYYNCGYNYALKGEYDKAIDNYTQAIKLQPYDDKFYIHRACVYAIKKEYDEAIDDYTCAIELDSDNVEAYINRSCAYNGKKEYDKAIDDSTKAIELRPNNVEAYINRGYAYNGKKEYDKAIDDYTCAIKLDSDNEKAYINRGDAYVGENNYISALRDYEYAIAISSNSSIPNKHLGEMCYKLGEFKEAIWFLNEAIRSNRKYKEAYEIRAKVHEEMGHPKRAARDKKKALAIKL